LIPWHATLKPGSVIALIITIVLFSYVGLYEVVFSACASTSLPFYVFYRLALNPPQDVSYQFMMFIFIAY